VVEHDEGLAGACRVSRHPEPADGEIALSWRGIGSNGHGVPLARQVFWNRTFSQYTMSTK
jgi:hypothetical protein